MFGRGRLRLPPLNWISFLLRTARAEPHPPAGTLRLGIPKTAAQTEVWGDILMSLRDYSTKTPTKLPDEPSNLRWLGGLAFDSGVFR